MLSGVDFIFKYVTKGLAAAKEHLTDEKSDELQDVIKYLDAVEKVKRSNDKQEVAHLVQEFQLSHEHVPTWLIKDSREVSARMGLHFIVPRCLQIII